jgi:hypothetical protein
MMTEKPKIEEIESHEYPLGRIDRLVIKDQKDIRVSIINLLVNLNFPKENLIDFDLESFERYIFSYSKRLKVHLFKSEDGLNLILDSKIKKEKLIKEVEKIFLIF